MLVISSVHETKLTCYTILNSKIYMFSRQNSFSGYSHLYNKISLKCWRSVSYSIQKSIFFYQTSSLNYLWAYMTFSPLHCGAYIYIQCFPIKELFFFCTYILVSRIEQQLMVADIHRRSDRGNNIPGILFVGSS